MYNCRTMSTIFNMSSFCLGRQQDCVMKVAVFAFVDAYLCAKRIIISGGEQLNVSYSYSSLSSSNLCLSHFLVSSLSSLDNFNIVFISHLSRKNNLNKHSFHNSQISRSEVPDAQTMILLCLDRKFKNKMSSPWYV